MIKYSDEFRRQIQEEAAQGVNTSELSRKYDIHEATITTLITDHWQREKRLASKKLFGDLQGKQETQSNMDDKELDSRHFNIWCYKFKKKLEETKLYNNLSVVYVGDRWFTYTTAGAYNKTVNFIDLYANKKGTL